MKRIVALLIVLASVISITACSLNPTPRTKEEVASSREAARSEMAAESSSIEAAIVDGKEEVLEKIGKSQKGKKLVMRDYNKSDDTERFREIFFDKNGFADYMVTYNFYPASNYKIILNQGDKRNDKLIDHDDDLRLIVYKKSYDSYGVEMTYDELRSNFETTTAWKIID